MNAKHMDKETFCLDCGRSLGVGYAAQKRKYCDSQCSGSHRTKKYLELWLATGELPTRKVGKTDAGGEQLRRTDLYSAPQASFIREHLLKRQEGRCAICNNEFVWQGKPLTSILDHVDGNGFNNHPDNMRLVCPNCSYQLPTSKGANKGNGRKVRWESADDAVIA